MNLAPDGLGTALLAATATVLTTLALAATWDTGTGWRRHARRATTAALTLLTAVATSLIWVNRQIETYTSWPGLLGRTADSQPVAPHRPGGGRIITLTVTGHHSGLTLPVYAYLPAAYDTHPHQHFPVIEALHGYPGSPLSWLRQLAAPAHLDQEIRAGRMAPTVVLFPYQTPAPLTDTECVNLNGGPQAETFLTVDVPAAARTRLRVRADRAGWALTGYSAGGYCATNLALRHPDRYAAAASLSGYATPGITIGDGTEHTLNDDTWRLRHLPAPAVALYLAAGRADRTCADDARTLAHLAHPPLTVTTSLLPGGGHNGATWQAMEDPAFDWLSSWLARPA
ncbi:esterase [Micromonospora sp. PLK6-60]|uniref:alpha/beta hydrolase n=1 Tax=Micromonospora sp. PLK6-60 TaxID=2873383 RepID=UPI001CA76D07|nr:alpha/beta hydrolase-fold protein [Micromonospora sp. PLK6-60]MBY8875009.1 esterase [Micromonospora sp. PLK6-60]